MPEIEVEITRREQSTTSEVHIRQHRVAVDRPLAKGGADQGPMGGELLLAALGGCFMSTLIAALTARELSVRDLAVRVSGTVDGTPPRFQSAKLEVRGSGLAQGELEKLVTVAERSCIVANTLRANLELTVAVV